MMSIYCILTICDISCITVIHVLMNAGGAW